MEREPLTKHEMPTHWNSAEVLAPVGISLWVKVTGGPFQVSDTKFLAIGSAPVKATRTSHVEKRGDELEYQLDHHDIRVNGLFEWAYP